MLRNFIVVILAGLILIPTAAWSQQGCDNGTVLANDDGTWETAYNWEGCNADHFIWYECYESLYICSMRLVLTQVGLWSGSHSIDVYVWENDGGQPGEVLCIYPDALVTEGIAFWPSVSQHDVPVHCCLEDVEEHFLGFLVRWDDEPEWYIGGDLDGPGGCPGTLVNDGCGTPTGMQPLENVMDPQGDPMFPGAKALGIREVALFDDCDPVPVSPQSWGSIKALY
ncbi:MAG: hypothetical protein GF355_00415 [Candidatus Eisenbacteria bacterium]|nr:hypothetical protein [Candidatus Eisenbacteria bacterium]